MNEQDRQNFVALAKERPDLIEGIIYGIRVSAQTLKDTEEELLKIQKNGIIWKKKEPTPLLFQKQVV